MASVGPALDDTIDSIGRTTSLESVIATLGEHGCPDLTSSVNLTTCTELPLAGGGFCDVYQGTITDGRKIALKALRVFYRPGKEDGSEKILKRAARELYYWSRLKHPNVLPLMGLAMFRGHLSMISEWMENGSLMSYVRLNPDANRISLCIEICAGLCYIHSKGMVHGDLKSANVMISAEGRAMIADFGNSRLRDFTLKFTDTTNSSFSFRWAAPEVLLQSSGPLSSKEADVYAYGMTALVHTIITIFETFLTYSLKETLTGKVPYEGTSEQRVFGLVAYEHTPPPRPTTGIDNEIWDIMLLCWTWEVPKRPTITSISKLLEALPMYSSVVPRSTENNTPSLIPPTQSIENPPEAPDGSMPVTSTYSPPIGIIRLWIKCAKNVKNVEAILGGKSDAYVRILLNSVVVGRTEIKPNNLNPEWDEIIYVPVHGLHEILYLECVDYKQLTKHRSLGFAKLSVSDLARATSDPKSPYSGIGRRDVVDAIRMDKGELHYSAEFFPAASPEGVTFLDWDKPQPSVDHTGVGDLDPGSESSIGGPRSRTDWSTLLDKLLDEQSGVIVFNVVEGEILRPARLEILLDGGRWPVLATEKARSTTELDFGVVRLRLNRDGSGNEENVVAEYKIDAKVFLEQSFASPLNFRLTDVDGHTQGIVRIQAKYVPVKIKIDPRESIVNMGTLLVELIGGRELHGADRNGMSDPFVVFSLNGSKVFKSSIKKKTLAPEWNERFEALVPSRLGAEFSLEVFDWNQVTAAKSLGSGQIGLFDILPFEVATHHVKLIHPKRGEKGAIQIRLLFRPEIIARADTKTSRV